MKKIILSMLAAAGAACALIASATLHAEPHLPRMPAKTRGIYLPATQTTSKTLPAALAMAEAAGLNTLVVDIKDSSGLVTLAGIKKEVSLASEFSAEESIDLKTLLEFCHSRHWWVIGRVAVLQDACLTQSQPAWAAQLKTGGVYLTGDKTACGDLGFISPYVDEAWDYAAEIAEFAANRGFDEIQLDYLRFPDDANGELAFPRQAGNLASRTDVIARGVARIRAALPEKILLSADLFGRTVEVPDEIIGQDLNKISAYLDYVSPMLYPFHWGAGNLGVKDPPRMPYEIIKASIAAMRAQMRAQRRPPQVRPWLQSGDWPDNYYGRSEVQAQIKAAHESGIDDWLLWNASGIYKPEDIRERPVPGRASRQ